MAAALSGALMFGAVGFGGSASADPLPIPPIPPLPGLPPIPLPPPLGPDKPEPKPKPKPGCSTRTNPFIPKAVKVTGVGTVPVIALRRDRDNVPGAPPTNNRGRGQMAFDLDSGIRPGDEQGNALLNAHTFPDGQALGNALLAELEEGDRVIVRGKRGQLCYRVTDRIEVRDGDKRARDRYYDKHGNPQIAIAVCSGRRLGPGHWTHRTLWFASPIN